jgi:thiopeptide-type bacteriocin biosynthesis protein
MESNALQPANLKFMKLKISPTVLFRVPKFSYEEQIQNNWEELKSAISESSKEFYDIIKNIGVEEFEHLPPKIKFTLWKYFNRAKFRATPYGSFAGYGLFNMTDTGQATPIVVENHQTVKALIDWPYKSTIDISIDKLIIAGYKIITNSTQYKVSEKHRYLAKSEDGFELCEHTCDPISEAILNQCEHGITVVSLIHQLISGDIGYDMLTGKIGELIEIQLLLTELHPNIIGEDYFQRIKVTGSVEIPKYLIAERHYRKGTLPANALEHLPGLIKTLNSIAGSQNNEALETFIRGFARKFEQREVPLMEALDPEIGVGYNALESITVADDFVKQFAGREKKESATDLFKVLLRDELLGSGSSSKPTLMLSELFKSEEHETDPLPNSFSAIVTVANELICLESLGGCTANALLGRFTLGDDVLINHCQRIAVEEQEANPDVMFFDLAYMDENHVDNINRRGQIYETQLSILNYDTSGHPIQLSDIMVCVKANKLVLRSKSLNKRLIPRMCSAYNYSRSDLSVFRLLCDLQYQGIKTLPEFKLETMFPKLKYYPRVRYKNILVATSKWRIKDMVQYFDKNPTIEKCRYFLQSRQVSRYFKTGFADQTLCFDLFNDQDLEALIRIINKDPDLLLTEVAVPNHVAVTDVEGKPYFAEFIVTLSHNETIYQGFSRNEELPGKHVPSIYPPATKWLYFEIYCHPIRANSILQQYINPFIRKHENAIDQWFFIRYNENGEHLRLRLKMTEDSKSHTLTSDLTNLLFDDLQSGIINDLQIRTYKREIERYHPEHIDAIELHFHTDSEFTISLLNDLPDEFQCYQLCYRIFEAVAEADLFGQTEMMNVVFANSEYFNDEHQLKPEDYKNLNERYRLYLQAAPYILSDLQGRRFTKLLQSFIDVLKDCKAEIRVQLFRDMLHMHVNRLFSDHQRTHEMIIYYFVLKDMKRKSALQSFADAN